MRRRRSVLLVVACLAGALGAAPPAARSALDNQASAGQDTTGKPAVQAPVPQAPAPGAKAPAAQPTFRSGVELLTVDVTVLDRNGQPVTNLLGPEFAVTIDGRPRRVLNVEYVHIDVEAAKKAAEFPIETAFTTNFGPPAGRSIVIVVDQSNMTTGSARPILATASTFLNKLSPLDRIAFIAIPPPGPSVDFTTDHVALRSAMMRVTGNASKFEGRFNIGQTEAIDISLRHNLAVRSEVVQRECAGAVRESLIICERDVELQATEMVTLQRSRVTETINALRALFGQLAWVEGQKLLILITEGLELEGIESELDDLALLAGKAGISISVLLMERPRADPSHAFLSPTATEDRDLEVRGLEMLTGQSRGALFRVVGTGQTIFEQLAVEMSGYYLLGVEAQPSDRDGKSHRIGVDVRRRGMTLRSRRAFVLPERPENARSAEQALRNALQSPVAVPELPLRVTTFAYQDPGSAKVRVVVAADVGQPGAPAGEFTMGIIVTDEEHRVMASLVEKKSLRPADDRTDAPLRYAGAVLVDPGIYTLRLGAVDPEGRRGTVLRALNAWNNAGGGLAVGDLIVGTAPTRADERMLPSVEPRVTDGRLAAYLEMYSPATDGFDQVSVTVEVAEDDSSPPLTTVPAQMLAEGAPTVRHAQAWVPTHMLPPGRYLARARITKDGKVAGLLTRPFVVMPADATGAAGSAVIPLPGNLVSAPPPFQVATVLRPEVLTAMLDLVRQAKPSLEKVVAVARGGDLTGAGMQALEAGDQDTGSLLRGIDLLNRGQTDKAAALLSVAAGPRRQFYPAAFYLGACFAASGRDREAASIWQEAIGSTPRPPFVYPLLADVRLRLGQPSLVIDLLRAAHEQWPADDDIARRLALALAMTGRHADAVPVLDGYLARHASDQDALFVAIVALYQSGTDHPRSDADRAKLQRYAAAYRGPQKVLVARYVEALQREQLPQ